VIERLRRYLKIVNAAIEDDEIRRDTFLWVGDEAAKLWELEDLRDEIEALLVWIDQGGESIEDVARSAEKVGASFAHMQTAQLRADSEQRRQIRADRRAGAKKTKQSVDTRSATRDAYIRERCAELSAAKAKNIHVTISSELKAMKDNNGEPVHRHNVSPTVVWRVIQSLQSE